MVKISLISFFFLAMSNFSMAQNVNDHEFVGRIYIDGKKAKNVTVMAFEGNKCFSKYETKSNGRFVFTGGVEKYYTLQFEKERIRNKKNHY